MHGYFEPPPDPWPEQVPASTSPRWTGRPQGRQVSEAVSDLLLAESDLAKVLIAYVDAYPDGFEIEISTSTTVAYHDLRRDGDDSGPDVFGRHWPIVGENRDVLPAQLFRVGVEFSDGRRATNIGGHDRPLRGPVISPLSGGGRGSGGKSWFRQGYWISPLPPAGMLTVLCEWPALHIPLVRREIESELLFSAARRATALFPAGSRVSRDDREWRVGTESDVAFIASAASAGTAIGHTIPPIYPAYCFLELPRQREKSALIEHERAVIELLAQKSDHEPWWLGYLDTGAHDVVFPYAPRVIPFYGHQYVLVEAGPQQAAAWRTEGWNWALPDLMFPADRSWMLSTGWDDTWTCIGGPEPLISSFKHHPVLGQRVKPEVPGGM